MCLLYLDSETVEYQTRPAIQAAAKLDTHFANTIRSEDRTPSTTRDLRKPPPFVAGQAGWRGRTAISLWIPEVCFCYYFDPRRSRWGNRGGSPQSGPELSAGCDAGQKLGDHRSLGGDAVPERGGNAGDLHRQSAAGAAGGERCRRDRRSR